MTQTTFHYGPCASQAGELHVPERDMPPVVCLLHGGFWRMPYGREQFAAVAEDLVRAGYAVWNIGYRRVGEPGGGWPGTAEDAASAIDHLATLSETVRRLDLRRVAVVGHSAGGQLALCVAAIRSTAADVRLAPRRVRPRAAAGLAAVTDLEAACAIDAGNGAARDLLGGTPAQQPQRYARVSPLRLLPLRVPQLIVHGTDDGAVPVDHARRYVRAAAQGGDPVHYVELAGGGHMDCLDVHSAAHRALRQWLDTVLKPAP